MKRLLTDNPCSRVRPPKKVKSVQKALTLVGLHTILTYLKGRSTLWFPTYLAAQTGMRMGEILGLTWENVDLDGGVLYIVGALYYPSRALGWEITLPKDEVTRDVYINEDTVNALKAHHKEQSVQRLKAGESWHDDGFVICDELGVPWLPSTTSSRFRDMSTRAGVPTHFHILRHTAVTLALSTGADMKNVADRTGHSVEMMLRVYAHSDPEVQKMITNRIGVMLK
jgi:integrase